MKRILFSLILLIAIGLTLFFVNSTKKKQFEDMAEAGKNMQMQPESVSTFEVEEQTWVDSFRAIGSIEPIQGVLLESEVSGIVESINFENGQEVKEGQVLVQFDVKVERAELRAAEALASLAEVELERAQRLRKSGNIPQSDLDRAVSDEEKTKADVETIKARIARKTITAPFTGKVGIRQINLGQYIPAGSAIVILQANEKVYVNFSLPQQSLAKIKTGLKIELHSDAYPESEFVGELTAISPEVDPLTRSVSLQGTLENPEGLLRAGLFVQVEVTLPIENKVLVVPSSAVLYAPYGNTVFKIEEDDTGLIARQHIIRTGSRRGDFVSIVEGASLGDEVVSAGAFKLRNGSSVIINNDLKPSPELKPTPDNS